MSLSKHACRFDQFNAKDLFNRRRSYETFSYFTDDTCDDYSPVTTFQMESESDSGFNLGFTINQMELELDDILVTKEKHEEELKTIEKKEEALHETLDPEHFKQGLRNKYKAIQDWTKVSKPEERTISEAFTLLFDADPNQDKCIYVPKDKTLANFVAKLVKKLQIKSKAAGRPPGPGSDLEMIKKLKDALRKAGWMRDETSHPLYYIFTQSH